MPSDRRSPASGQPPHRQTQPSPHVAKDASWARSFARKSPVTSGLARVVEGDHSVSHRTAFTRLRSHVRFPTTVARRSLDLRGRPGKIRRGDRVMRIIRTRKAASAVARRSDRHARRLDGSRPPERRTSRPKGATPLRASMVPAFKACAAPNRTHGAPLAFPSCNPPVQSSTSSRSARRTPTAPRRTLSRSSC